MSREGGIDQFVVRDELSADQASSIIEQYVELNLDEQTINFTDAYDEAPLRVRLLVPLLGVHAISKYNNLDPIAIDPAELAEAADEVIGSAYPEIRELEQEGVIENVGKQYRVAEVSPEVLSDVFDGDARRQTVG
jgi:hypothetical protein